jgi:hypothetical protein
MWFRPRTAVDFPRVSESGHTTPPDPQRVIGDEPPGVSAARRYDGSVRTALRSPRSEPAPVQPRPAGAVWLRGIGRRIPDSIFGQGCSIKGTPAGFENRIFCFVREWPWALTAPSAFS